MAYHLGIDLGTTRTAVAICRPAAATAEPVGVVASTVFVGADGALLVGESAERRALSDPARVVHGFARRIGDATPVLVGGRAVAAEVLAAMLVAHLVAEARRREGEPPSRVAVAHPAGWGAHRVAALAAALAGRGVGPVLLLPGPLAAATGAGPGRPGALVAVYDLGGTTAGAAVVRAVDGGGYELVGTPETVEGFGGVDVDDVVLGHVREAIGPAWDELDAADPEVLAAVARLRRECTSAKEALSADTEVSIPVMLPSVHTTVRLARADLEERIRPAVLESVEALVRVIRAAGVDAADLDGLLLAGGSACIPLVAELVPAGVGRAAAAGLDPGRLAAAGAALAARAADGPVDGGGAATAPEPTVVVAPHRPAKQARPFAGAEPPPGSRRGVALAVAAGLAVAVLAGGAVAFGAARIGRGSNADAATPAPVPAATTSAGAPAFGPGPPRVRTAPTPQRTPPAPARTRDAAPAGPPATTAAPAPETTVRAVPPSSPAAAPTSTAPPSTRADGGPAAPAVDPGPAPTPPQEAPAGAAPS